MPMITKKKLTMTKKKLINEISQDKNMPPNDVRNILQAGLDKMAECLIRGERIEFRDFGVFEIVLRKQKVGRNPKDAAKPIVIPSRPAVKFTAGKKMRRRIETNLKISKAPEKGPERIPGKL